MTAPAVSAPSGTRLKALERVTYIGRQALRDTLFATSGFDGMGGEITCNEHGDCAGFKFAAYKFVDADPESFEIGKNPVKIFP